MAGQQLNKFHTPSPDASTKQCFAQSNLGNIIPENNKKPEENILSGVIELWRNMGHSARTPADRDWGRIWKEKKWATTTDQLLQKNLRYGGFWIFAGYPIESKTLCGPQHQRRTCTTQTMLAQDLGGAAHSQTKDVLTRCHATTEKPGVGQIPPRSDASSGLIAKRCGCCFYVWHA
ncbi:hypothetical protein PWT90_00251 [Aphanocladium album]|nr:hypothetical protein PWT90_00251 [Aphanocladium album]